MPKVPFVHFSSFIGMARNTPPITWLSCIRTKPSLGGDIRAPDLSADFGIDIPSPSGITVCRD